MDLATEQNIANEQPTGDLTALQVAVNSLGETPDINQVLELMCKVDAFKGRIKEVELNCKQAIINHIKATGKNVILGGGMQWTYSRKKQTDCIDETEAADDGRRSAGTRINRAGQSPDLFEPEPDGERMGRAASRE